MEELVPQTENTEVVNFTDGEFALPRRNWALLIDSYNSSHKKKFPYSPLDCSRLIDYAKKSVPVKSVFKAIGTSPQKYTNLLNNYVTMEERMVELASKSDHTEEEYAEFQDLMRNPYRILMADIDRAEGCSELKDWERFNEMAYMTNQTMELKMKSKFRDFFDAKDSGTQSGNVVINIASGFLEDL